MAAAQTPKYLRTFRDIQDAIFEQLKYQSTDSVSRNRVKRNINNAMDEAMSMTNWRWARGTCSLSVEPYYSSGTANVTANSVTVPLTAAIAGSKKGYIFSVNGFAETYRIKSHIAGSSTIQLMTPYAGTTNSIASFKIWNDSVPLPVDCSETIEIRQPYRETPLDSMGLQEFRRIVALTPKFEGRPAVYTTSDFKDPEPYVDISGLPAVTLRGSKGLIKYIQFESDVSTFLFEGSRIEVSNAGQYSYNVESIISLVSSNTISYTGTSSLQEDAAVETDAVVQILSNEGFDRYRELLIYPAISQYRTTIDVDYKRLVQPLTHDTDEPPMPIADRMVLFYGGMWLSADREKDPETAQNYYQLFIDRLARLASKSEDSVDKPVMGVSKTYLANKRMGSRSRDLSTGRGSISGWGGGGSTLPSGRANSVATFGSDGTLIGSSTIDTTELGYLDNVDPLTTVNCLNDATTQVVIYPLANFDSVHLDYSLKRGSVLETGTILMTSDGSIAAIANASAQTDLTGVDFNAVTDGSNLILEAVLDSSGADAIVKYKTNKWLS